MQQQRQKKVFLVEDDPLLIDIYTTKLKEAGYIVEGADNGEKALKQVVKANPAIIILDIVLPHLDGWGILAQIRSKKQLRDTKVLILSNLGQKEEIEKGLALGADRYLIKAHYTPSQVVQEVEKLLSSTYDV